MNQINCLPDDVCYLIDQGFSNKNKEKGLEVGEQYFLPRDFVENLYSVLEEYEIKSDHQGLIPSECRNQIWRIILNNIDDCIRTNEEDLEEVE